MRGGLKYHPLNRLMALQIPVEAQHGSLSESVSR